MARYIARRLLMLIPVLLGVFTVVFVTMQIVPGDPARLIAGEEATGEQLAAIRKEWGIDDPLIVQYLRYLRKVAVGDLGESIKSKRPVIEEIIARYPNTILLAVASLVIMVIFGITTGVISAVKQNSLFDNLSMAFALIGVSMPVFWLGLMLMLLFSVQLGWLPSVGKGGIQHLVLPAVTLGMATTAVVARMTRSSMLEVIRQDYIRTAWAKGLDERRVVFRHALKNAMIPTITVIGLNFGTLLAGAVLTETVFAWPGIGRMIVDAISMRDFPVVQGAVLLIATTYALVNLAVDVIYAFFDPRIRFE